MQFLPLVTHEIYAPTLPELLLHQPAILKMLLQLPFVLGACYSYQLGPSIALRLFPQLVLNVQRFQSCQAVNIRRLC